MEFVFILILLDPNTDLLRAQHYEEHGFRAVVKYAKYAYIHPDIEVDREASYFLFHLVNVEARCSSVKSVSSQSSLNSSRADQPLRDMKEVLYEVRCLKSTEDMILALTGQFKQLSHEPEKFR